MLTSKKKQTIIKKHQVHKTDTGSKIVQAAMLTEKIDLLATHLKKHKKEKMLFLKNVILISNNSLNSRKCLFAP